MKRLVLFLSIACAMQMTYSQQDAIEFIKQETDYELSGLSEYAFDKLKNLGNESFNLLTVSPPGFTSGTYSNPKTVYDLLYDQLVKNNDLVLRYFDLEANKILKEVMGLYDQLPVIIELTNLNILETSNTRNTFELLVSAVIDEIKSELVDIKNEMLYSASQYIDSKIDEYQQKIAQGLQVEVYSAPVEKSGFWGGVSYVASNSWSVFKSEAFESKIDPKTGECEKITDSSGSAKQYSVGFLTGSSSKDTVCRSLIDQFYSDIGIATNNLIEDLGKELETIQEEAKKDITENIANAPSVIRELIKGKKDEKEKTEDESTSTPTPSPAPAPSPAPSSEPAPAPLPAPEPTQDFGTTDPTEALFLEINESEPNIEIIEAAIGSFGADVNAYDSDGWTPLLITLGKQPRKEALALELLKLGADPNKAHKSSGVAPLMESVRKEYFQAGYGNTQVDTALINTYKAEVDAQDNAGKTALLYASQSFNLPSVKILTDSFADPNITNNNGQNALNLVGQWYGNQKEEFTKQNKLPEFYDLALNIVKELIDADIDVNNQANTDKTTALMWFVAADDKNIVQTLLDAGSDPTIEDALGQSAFEYAKQDSEMQKLLESNLVQGISPEELSSAAASR